MSLLKTISWHQKEVQDSAKLATESILWQPIIRKEPDL